MTTVDGPAVYGPGVADVYSGTAADDLKALNSPALNVIAQINARVAAATQIALLPGAQLWSSPTAERWLAPLGQDLRLGVISMTKVFDASPYLKDFVGTESYFSDQPGKPIPVDAPSELNDDIPAGESPAYDAFKDLMRWLSATDQEISDMAGIGRTTPYTWKREGREPRRSTVRKLFQVHAVVSSVVNSFGEAKATKWLAFEHPEYRESLLDGDIEAVQAPLHDALFKRARPARPGSWLPESAGSGQ